MRQAIWVRLFDLHCDTLDVCLREQGSIHNHTGAVDLCRGRVFRPWLQAFAAWLRDGLSAGEAQKQCRCLLDTAHRWACEEPDFRLIRQPADLATPFCGCSGLLTVENGGALGTDLSVLESLSERAVHMVGLTWNGDNHWASGCMGDPAQGLTRAGQKAIQTLEAMHITVDVSHLNATGFWQVAELARRPFVASHSNAAAVFPHPRNLTDDQFRAIRDSGGVVGLNLYAGHLGDGGVPEQFRRHLEHFLSLDGERCVCIGSDLDGMDIPADWNGICILIRLWDHLREQGYSTHLLEAIFYHNAFDFFRRVL